MGASLSANGLKLTQDIMKTNETLGELNNNDFAKYGEWKYSVRLFYVGLDVGIINNTSICY